MIGDAPPRREGRRVVLRVFEAGDGGAIWEAVQELRYNVAPWQEWPVRHRSPGNSEREVLRMRRQFLAREYFYYAVRDRLDNRFLGWAGLEPADRRLPAYSVGFWLSSSAEGQGLMSEALTLLIEMAFAALRAGRVAIAAEVGNGRSIALAERLGFQFAGTLRSSLMAADGSIRDAQVYSLIASDRAAADRQ